MRVLVWIVLTGLAATIVVGSLFTTMTRWPGITSNMTHLLAYAALGAMMVLALQGRRQHVALALGITAAIGAGVELSQILVPARSFSFMDLGMNIFGAAIGVTGAAVLGRVASVLGFR